MKRLLVLLIVILIALPVFADEGMWLPSQIEGQVKEMRKRGFKLKAADLYSPDKPSLSDAVVLFGRGCTGAIVSNEGLLLTNHHCGYGQIQQHSSVEHDYLTDGFWAMNKGEELPNSGLKVRILVRMEDVTGAVEAGRSKEILEQAEQAGRYKAEIKPLYYGNQHWMWVYEEFTDVRLVAAPPSSIGKFGGDTDNWMWPRHTGDFSVFRIYAGTDNRPADYSPDNVPYRPAKYFTISDKGFKEGDFTFVYGFPGTTQQYITSDAVRYILEKSNPMRIDLRTRRLGIIAAAQEADPATRIKYASKHAGIANGWKKWQGESRGLTRRGTVEKKRAYEAGFRRWAAGKSEYAHLLDSMEAAYARAVPGFFRRELYGETISAIELLQAAFMGVVSSGSKNGLPAAWYMEYFDNFYKDYEPEIDRRIAAEMVKGFMEKSDRVPEYLTRLVDSLGGYQAAADWLFDNSSFVSRDKLLAAARDSLSFASAVASEPILKLRNEMWKDLKFSDLYWTQLSSVPTIAQWYTPYMKALMEFDAGRRFYPDANLTLRISYGAVEGYRYEDAVWHDYVTTIDGIIAKDNPEIYDYDIPERLRDLYAARDFGRWTAMVDGRETVPVCFIASNHTSGGNSGSPILNAHGELLGLNFDRTWVSTMSDIEFDPEICRNISVDVRYVMFVIEKVGGANWLVDEMTFSGGR